MNSAYTIVLLSCFLVLNPCSATSNLFSPSPLLSPNFGDVCKEAVCGKGTCKTSQNATFPFVCECEPGWKQTRLDHDDGLKFLPCVIPNCTLDYSCGNAPSPVPSKEKPANNTFFDPCSWSYCGEGTCNKTSAFTYTCDCKEGFYNLLNVTHLPCFRDCALGMDCSNLGINVRNNSSPSPALADNRNNQDRIRMHGYFNWLILLVAAILW